MNEVSEFQAFRGSGMEVLDISGFVQFNCTFGASEFVAAAQA
jgi:hypothetical protein